MYEDKTLVCKDCGENFIFTSGEQEFYASKGFENEPTRCSGCRGLRKSQSRDLSQKRSREMYDAVCAECGNETQVPFKPRLEKPVYCSDCFSSHKST